METTKHLKILMLEDNLDDAGLIERILKKDNLDFIRECVDTREEFNEAIQRFKPDVILSDHGLPGFNSREALKICLKEMSNTPFILVTGTVSDDYAIACIREGADDYILKSNLSRLPSAIRSAVKRRKLEKLKREARHALRQQNAELVKVNKELDNFVYSVSHNLRGPLASVMGLLNLTKEEQDQKTLQSIHTMMRDSVDKLDGTLGEILEYSKNARNEISITQISWKEIINTSLRKLEYMHEYQHVEKVIRIEADIPFFSDEERINVMLTNVLSNAILYCGKHDKRFIDICVTSSDSGVTLVVKDNGIGIQQDILPKIYTMFYRGTEDSKGSGLGLYITKEIISKLKGSISITSEFGEGTEVTIVLPSLVSTHTL